MAWYFDIGIPGFWVTSQLVRPWVFHFCETIHFPWRIHGAAIYGNMDPINVPQMLAYIPAPWILWVLGFIKRVLSLFNSLSVGSRRTTTREIQLGFQWMAMLNGANWLSIINITLEGLPFGVLSGHITMEQKKLPMCWSSPRASNKIHSYAAEEWNLTV